MVMAAACELVPVLRAGVTARELPVSMPCRCTGGQGGFLPQRTVVVVVAAAVVPAAVHASSLSIDWNMWMTFGNSKSEHSESVRGKLRLE